MSTIIHTILAFFSADAEEALHQWRKVRRENRVYRIETGEANLIDRAVSFLRGWDIDSGKGHHHDWVYAPHALQEVLDDYGWPMVDGNDRRMIGENPDPEDHFEIIKLAVETGAEYERTPLEAFLMNTARHYWDTPCHVVTYAVGRAYGGPEEGGWYYTAYDVADTVQVDGDNWPKIISEAQAIQRAKAEAAEAGEDFDTGYAIYGDEGFCTVIEVTDEPGHRARQPRPFYC